MFKKMPVLLVLIFSFNFLSFAANAGTPSMVCKSSDCDESNSSGCIRFEVQLHQIENQNWVKVSRAYKGMKDVFYYGRVERVEANSNENQCSFFYSEIEHTQKEFSLMVDAQKDEGHLNLLISGESLPENMSKLKCSFDQSFKTHDCKN